MQRHPGKLLFVAAAALATLAFAQGQDPAPARAPEKAEKPAIVTMQGQVIDLACYLLLDALGGDHQACAEACVKGGATLGFKTKETTYLVLSDPMHIKDRPDLMKFVNKDAEITANAFTKDGISALQIQTIK